MFEEKTLLPASEVKLHFGEILNQCIYQKKAVFIKKHEKPVAVIVSLEEWEEKVGKQSSLQTNPLIKEFEEFWEQTKPSYKKKLAAVNSVNLIRKLRDERSKKLMILTTKKRATK